LESPDRLCAHQGSVESRQMATFTEDDQNRLDWRLLRDGAVTLYFRRSFFDQDAAWLKDNGYAVHVIDCTESSRFDWEMTRAFKFKENFGYEPWTGNLDALNDAFRCLDFDSLTGIALCFVRFDALFAKDSRLANGVLDVVECRSRENLLVGNRLLALVQSNEPFIQIAPIGARTPQWNEEEWFNDSRRG
jgi:hypothetical protein